MRVLIIEDEVRLARNVADVLQATCGYAVDVSTEGEDGRHMALSNPYDLVILDLMLPKVGGLAILRDLRAAGAGVPVELTAMEYRVLEYLALRADEIVSKAEILEHLYDFDAERFSNVVEVYISSLRRKLGAGSGKAIVRTFRGQGYRLEAGET